MMGCLRSSSTVSPHHDAMNIQMRFETMIERVWRCTQRPELYKLEGGKRMILEIHMDGVIQLV
jgi:hypothetical protein